MLPWDAARPLDAAKARRLNHPNDHKPPHPLKGKPKRPVTASRICIGRQLCEAPGGTPQRHRRLALRDGFDPFLLRSGAQDPIRQRVGSAALQPPQGRKGADELMWPVILLSRGEHRSCIIMLDKPGIVETPVEARQGFLDRPVLVVLVSSLFLVLIALALVYGGYFGAR
jgi:hypothetical protein